jgi:hypothetical protein
MRRLQTTQPSFQQGFLLELLVFLGLMFFRTLEELEEINQLLEEMDKMEQRGGRGSRGR